MNKSISLILLAVVIVAVAAWVVLRPSSGGKTVQETTPTTQTEPSAQTQATTSPKATYTMAQVSTHKDASSCWSVVDGVVYDLTSWISRHPGGERAILSICGIDGTAAFRGQHGTNTKQENILATMKIGVLAQ